MWPFDNVVDAINGIISTLPGLINLVLYPLLRIQELLYQLFMYAIDKFYLLLNNLLAIPTLLFGFFETVFADVLPFTILILFGSMFLIVVALRVYSFLKDIEILGFKI